MRTRMAVTAAAVRAASVRAVSIAAAASRIDIFSSSTLLNVACEGGAASGGLIDPEAPGHDQGGDGLGRSQPRRQNLHPRRTAHRTRLNRDHPGGGGGRHCCHIRHRRQRDEVQ